MLGAREGGERRKGGMLGVREGGERREGGRAGGGGGVLLFKGVFWGVKECFWC